MADVVGNIKATGTITSSSAALKEKVAPIDDAPCRLWRMLLVNGYTELAVNSEHAIAVNDLPPLHKDPFDRILVAQARVEGIVLLTVDKVVAKYGEGVRKV